MLNSIISMPCPNNFKDYLLYKEQSFSFHSRRTIADRLRLWPEVIQETIRRQSRFCILVDSAALLSACYDHISSHISLLYDVPFPQDITSSHFLKSCALAVSIPFKISHSLLYSVPLPLFAKLRKRCVNEVRV